MTLNISSRHCECVAFPLMGRPKPKAVKYHVVNPGMHISWLTLHVSFPHLLKVGFKRHCAPRLVTTQMAQSQTESVSFSKSDSARGSAFLASSQVMLLLLLGQGPYSKDICATFYPINFSRPPHSELVFLPTHPKPYKQIKGG